MTNADQIERRTILERPAKGFLKIKPKYICLSAFILLFDIEAFLEEAINHNLSRFFCLFEAMGFKKVFIKILRIIKISHAPLTNELYHRTNLSVRTMTVQSAQTRPCSKL